MASLFYHSVSFRGGANPIQMFLGTFSSIFSGANFPVTLLPPWIRIVSYALPQTYAIDASRRALQWGIQDPTILLSLIALLTIGAISTSIGYYFLKTGIKKIRKEASPSPPAELSSTPKTCYKVAAREIGINEAKKGLERLVESGYRVSDNVLNQAYRPLGEQK